MPHKYCKLLLFFIYYLAFSSSLYSQENSSFIHLDKKFSTVFSIDTDSLGFMYFFDRNGFHKYDGYDYSFTSSSSIFTNNSLNVQILLVTRDRKNHFWFANQNGDIVNFNPYTFQKNVNYRRDTNKKLQFTSIYAYKSNLWLGSKHGILYKLDENKQYIDSLTSLPTIKTIDQTILNFAITSLGQLWISTDKGKIYSYNEPQNELNELVLPFNNNISQEIRITNDNRGWLWIATELNGLYAYDANTKSFDRYDNLVDSFNQNRNPMFISIIADNEGIVWAGTDGDGLFRIDPVKKKSTVSTYSKANKFSIGNNTIMNIFEDVKGNLWLTLKGGKIDILVANVNQINYICGSQNQEPVPVLSMLKSSDGSLWIGTDGKGLNKALQDSTNVQYNEHAIGSNYFIGRYIQGLVEDDAENIWIATYQNGLWVYNSDQKKFKKINTTDSFNRYSSDIRTLYKDSKDRIWASSGVAIQVFSSKMELLATFDYNSHGLNGNLSQAITEDRNNQVWIGLNNGGLFQFMEDEDNLSFSHFIKHVYYHADKNHNYNYNITGLQADFNNNLWITNASGFITKFNAATKKFESYLGKKQLQDIRVKSLLVEDKNNIWFSSGEGLHHFNTLKNELKSYFQVDGLRDSDFFMRSAHKDASGAFYFGGENGVNSFLPSEMEKLDSNAKLCFSSIEVLNKPANSIIPKQLVVGINNLKELSLNAYQSSFSFQFVAMDNILNPNYHYAYRLVGFNEDWIDAKKDRVATYTNIPSGNYTFEVKAGTRKDVWNIPSKTIDISIKPQWWNSPLAYLFYFILFAFLAYGFILWIRLKNRLSKEEWQNQKDKELYALKMNFFAKMSHEIQTPLTLILGPINDMMDRAKENKNRLLIQRLSMISNNANRLSRIAMELMTVRNKELGRLRIFASKNNLIEDLERISMSFTEQARFKNIDFFQVFPKEVINVWYDVDKIEHIIYNLLSNAFKFTPKEGAISIEVKENTEKECVEISVVDSGPGIPKEELEDIFKLFYQSELGKNNKGYGIGLALAKELISLHKGQIDVTSAPETGTCFRIKLSTKENIFSEEDKIMVESKDSLIKSFNESKALEKELSLNIKSIASKAYTILVVEDNIEMQIFLRDVLSDTYNVLIAENGQQGVDMAKKEHPDLILSDVMMPVMDGIEMCKILQKKKSTSHIPIILLTAKNTTITKLKGLKSGAIEYIKKPFNFNELALKINNIIASKEKIISKYRTDLISTPTDDNVKSKDEIFVEALVNELNNQIENPDFKLEELSNTLNMSYSVIYRKCQDITGKTLVEFVRALRIKKAALLIIEQGYNISEAAYMVGYKDSKYFTKCFKEEFGVPPATFKKKQKKNGVTELVRKFKILL